MFRYYNANPFGRLVNDCTVRAISLATEQSWDSTYKKLINDYLADQFPRFCPEERIYTLADFLDLKLPGRWLVTMSGHITCVIDGICYDTFDPSKRYVWCIYKVK